MADEKPEVGIGNIKVVLNGQDYELVPTLGAAQGVSRIGGGLRAIIGRVVDLDLDLITRIINLGLGPKVVKELGGAEKVAEYVWQTGLLDGEGDLSALVARYVTHLANGGRPPKEANDDTTNPPK